MDLITHFIDAHMPAWKEKRKSKEAQIIQPPSGLLEKLPMKYMTLNLALLRHDLHEQY